MANKKKEILLLLQKDDNSLSQLLKTTPSDFAHLIEMFYDQDKRIQLTTSSFLAPFVSKHPDYITPYIPKLISNLQSETRVGVKRNTLRILQEKQFFRQLSEQEIGLITDICFQYLEDTSEPIAIKAFSMTILQYVVEQYPELRDELKTIIEDLITYGSMGIKSRGEKVLNVLTKI